MVHQSHHARECPLDRDEKAAIIHFPNFVVFHHIVFSLAIVVSDRQRQIRSVCKKSLIDISKSHSYQRNDPAHCRVCYS